MMNLILANIFHQHLGPCYIKVPVLHIIIFPIPVPCRRLTCLQRTDVKMLGEILYPCQIHPSHTELKRKNTILILKYNIILNSPADW